jgi:hypothetical protein
MEKTFKIEYGERVFAVVSPEGYDPDGNPQETATYAAVATVLYQDRVYAAYLHGNEEELHSDPNDPEPAVLKPGPTAVVYDITDWPTMVPVKTVTEAVVFDEDEEDDEEEPGPAAD